MIFGSRYGTICKREGSALDYCMWEDKPMESKDYIVSGIEGAYAYLRDLETGEEICVALAALPEGVALGSKVHSEMCTYSLLD